MHDPVAAFDARRAAPAWWSLLGACLGCLLLLPSQGHASNPDMPELAELEWILDSQAASLTGIVFDIREYDPDALVWVLPRLAAYMELIERARPGLPVALISHGDEMALLTTQAARTHAELHRELRRLHARGLTIHVCATFARQLGLDETDFPPYVDVVPYGPAQLEDYVQMGYGHVSLEITW